MKRTRRSIAITTVIVLAGIAVYSPVYRAGYVYDDHVYVENNPDVHGPLADIWVRPSSPDYWPVTWTSFWLEWRLFGDDPTVMHAMNVGLHVLAALLVWRVLAALAVPGAALAGLLFAVHPVNVESAAWIIEQKNTLSAVLYLATTLAWIQFEREGRTRDGIASVSLFVLACLAKSSGIMLPFVLLGIAAYRTGRVQRRLWPWIAALFLAALALGLTTIAFQWTRAMPDDPPALTTLAERLAGAARAYLFYAQKAFVPAGLAFVYPEWPTDRDVLFYAPLVAIALVGLVIWIRRRTVNRPMLYALGFHAAMLCPILGLIDTTFSRISPVANQYQYLAIIGPIAVASAGAAYLASRLGRTPIVVLTGLVVALCAALTFRRAGAFENDLALWKMAAHDAPLSMYATLRYNDALLERDRGEEAARSLAAFVERTQDEAARHRVKGVLFFDRGLYAESTDELLKALALRPTPLETTIGGQLVDAGRCDDAIALLSAAVEAMPRAVEARYSLGMALVCAGRAQEAVTLFRSSCEIWPGNTKLQRGLMAAMLYARSSAVP